MGMNIFKRALPLLIFKAISPDRTAPTAPYKMPPREKVIIVNAKFKIPKTV